MQTIEEDPREILESNFSKQMTTDLMNSKSSLKQKNSPFSTVFDNFKNEPEQKVKQYYRNNSQINFKKKKNRIKRQSVQENSNENFDFEFE